MQSSLPSAMGSSLQTNLNTTTFPLTSSSSISPSKKKKNSHKLQSKKINIEQLTKQILRHMQKFYLVGITGRTSFILENLKGMKFKITIGNEIKCSCVPENKYHCMHTLYVLTEIFYLPVDHELLLQSKYTDKELRYIIANRRIYENRISDFLKFIQKGGSSGQRSSSAVKGHRNQRGNSKQNNMKSPTKSQSQSQNSAKALSNVNNLLIMNKRSSAQYENSFHLNDSSQHNDTIPQQKDEDFDENQEQNEDLQNLCAICHMHIVKSDPITTCTNVCRNKFHLQCFSQWMKYQLKNDGVVKCPLCRDEKSQDSLLLIKKKQYEIKESINSKKIGICYNYYCNGCQLKEIEDNHTVYKCVECQDVILCESCFSRGKHIRHTFICRFGSQKKWKQAEDRKLKRKIDAENGLIRMKLPTCKRLYNFLACTYPTYFSKNNRWNVIECKKIDIKIEDLECMVCKDPQKSFLRRLPCGHFIHHKCLRKRIEKGQLYCKYEGQKFLIGYQSLLKQEELNKKVQFEIDAVIKEEKECGGRNGNRNSDQDEDGGNQENPHNDDNSSSPFRKKSHIKNHEQLLLSNSKTLKYLHSGNNHNSKSLQNNTSYDSKGRRKEFNSNYKLCIGGLSTNHSGSSSKDKVRKRKTTSKDNKRCNKSLMNKFHNGTDTSIRDQKNGNYQSDDEQMDIEKKVEKNSGCYVDGVREVVENEFQVQSHRMRQEGREVRYSGGNNSKNYDRKDIGGDLNCQ